MPIFASTCINVLQLKAPTATPASAQSDLYKAVKTNSRSEPPSEVLQISSTNLCKTFPGDNDVARLMEVKKFSIVKTLDANVDARAKLAWSCTEDNERIQVQNLGLVGGNSRKRKKKSFLNTILGL